MGEQECRPAEDFGLATVDDSAGMDPAGIKVLQEYVREFLAQPNPDLGLDQEPNRSVCPFIPGALAKKTLYLKVGRGFTSRQQIESFVDYYRRSFKSIEPCFGDGVDYKAILLIFPDVADRDAPAVIDEVQKRLKPLFVAEGLMIGEFHRLNETPGVYNPRFRPMRSPVPMLAIREMVPEDHPFLINENIPEEQRGLYAKAWLTAFLKWNPSHFGTARARKTIAAAQIVVRLILPEA